MSDRDPRESLRNARRVVVKVGSSTLTRDGELRTRKFGDIARQVSNLLDGGREVVLVSSGAIAIGRKQLGWDHPGRTIPEKQAAAAVGQIGLVDTYRRRFAVRRKQVAQVLLTRHGLEDRERFLNARHTLHELLRLGVVPIVNENDTVATEEIRFGDNDNLAAIVASLVGADLLIILTDVDGLYVEPPRPRARRPALHRTVEKITPEIRASARDSDSAFARGGMITKLEAAETATRSGAATVLCNGGRANILEKVVAGEPVGTLFPAGMRMASRKHWLAFANRVRGRLLLDPGATEALLHRGRSLLPAGVVGVEGEFKIGDLVACMDGEGREVARGLVAYGSDEIARIKGVVTPELERVLGYSNGDELIHRDDLVTLDESRERS